MTPSIPYVPVDDKPWRLTMGLRPLRPEAWLEVDGRRGPELVRKQQLLREAHADVVATLPGSEPAGRELLHAVLDHLGEHHRGLVRVRPDGGIEETTTGERIEPATLHPIDVAGRLVQEDLCVMATSEGSWRLVGASVCFPSRWRLADKLGRDLSAIHGPVPGYEGSLARPTAAFFDRLRPERPVWRLNWTLIDHPDLHQPGAGLRIGASPGPAEARPAGSPSLWFRVERQTLRRLPVQGAVVFTIRTYVAAIGELVASHPEVVADLRATLPTVPPDVLAYKGWTGLIGPLVEWLDAGPSPGPPAPV